MRFVFCFYTLLVILFFGLVHQASFFIVLFMFELLLLVVLISLHLVKFFVIGFLLVAVWALFALV